MDPRGLRYGKLRKSYIINIMNSLDRKYRLINTQKILNLAKRNKKSLEARAKSNS